MMNDPIQNDGASDVRWPTREPRIPMPETAILRGSDAAVPAATALLRSAAQGAHATIDHLADAAAPAVQQLGEGVSAAEDALHMKTDQLRDLRDEWARNVRVTVPWASESATSFQCE